MYDARKLLENGDFIFHNGMKIVVKKSIGCGGNAAAYIAEYEDSSVSGGIHKCILKELFPFHPDNKIYRTEDGKIACSEDTKEIFEMSDIDGGLVGGASLDAQEFAKIVNYK